MLRFTAEQFFSVFEAYNRAIWPFQLAAHILGLAAILAALRRSPGLGAGAQERHGGEDGAGAASGQGCRYPCRYPGPNPACGFVR